MGEVHYPISETAKRVGVESHALRHWEEELSLPIGRTEMGHRYYTEEDIQLFSCIKELKEQGILLKEIKELLPDILHTKALLKAKKEIPVTTNTVPATTADSSVSITSSAVFPSQPGLEEFQEFLGTTLQNVITENNKILEENISRNVSEQIAKEMDLMLSAKERLEEDRFRKLDHLIRQQQTIRKETSRSTVSRYLRRFLGES